MTSDPLELLLPPPQRLQRRARGCALGPRVALQLAGAAETAQPWFDRLASGLALHGLELFATADDRHDVLTTLEPQGVLAPQGYRLEVDGGGVQLVASDAAGLFYAVATLLQVAELTRAADAVPGELALPGLALEDAPDFALRGVQLDVSRDKVPTLATLTALVDRLAGWKINQLQLYTEHTFAYRGHEVVWQASGAYDAEDMRALDRHCRARHVELVPNQQSFGHWHRWLVHEPYRALSELPEGIEHPFSPRREPYGLCPTDPRAIELLCELYDQLLPNFSSRQINVGLDETVDLGLGRSAEACRTRGTDRVYLDFLRTIHARLAERGHRMQFYGDIVLARTELLAQLPRDVVVLDWGYEADHPFDESQAALAESGLESYVCPGTSSWQSLGGRTTNALENLRRAACAGREHGAHGYLITDWGDRGHPQPLAVSEAGFAFGAAAAWNARAVEGDFELAQRLDRHAFHDAAGRLGRVALELGDAYRVAGSQVANGSALFFLLAFADEDLPHERMAGIDPASLGRTLEHLDALRPELAAARPIGPCGELVTRELGWVLEVLAFCCRLGRARLASDPPAPTAALGAAGAALASELRGLIGPYREIWLARNRAPGLDDSARRFERLTERLAGRAAPRR